MESVETAAFHSKSALPFSLTERAGIPIETALPEPSDRPPFPRAWRGQDRLADPANEI
jgi:hypothetical protein